VARYRVTIHSTLSADAAFAYLSDFSSTREWDPNAADAKRLDDGPVALGSKFLVEAALGKRRLPLEYTITAFEPPRRVQFRATSSLLASVDEITFSPSGDGCDVTYDADLKGRKWFALFDPFLSLVFKRIGDQARDGLIRELNK